MFAKPPRAAAIVYVETACKYMYLVMNEMLVVMWHALHIPGESAIALELAACALPSATWSNQPPLLEQAQILKV